MNETKPKKVVGRNVAVALGIICIILIALTAYFTITGISAQNSYNNLQNKYNQLQNQNNQLQNIVSLTNFTVWANDQIISQPSALITYGNSSYVYWTESVSYAGYISITILSSTNNLTWAAVVYNYPIINSPSTRYYAYDVNYNNIADIGTNGTAYLPVLPCSSISVEVGNGNLQSGWVDKVTIVYYY